MDMVHPSSDMRSATSGVPERSEPRPTETPAAPEEPEASDTKSTDWPDPLDFHGFKDEEASDEMPAAETAEPASTTPLESPFLSGAKVEKRPLGAFSEAANDMPMLEASDEKLLESGDDEPALPEESAEPESTPEPAPSEPEETEPTPEPEPVPPAMASITQQYKEHPATDDQPSGAIYDTEAYHQALTHTPQKHTGVLVVVWIIALILVGGGIGAGVYFLLPIL
jgi:hypothetical protein